MAPECSRSSTPTTGRGPTPQLARHGASPSRWSTGIGTSCRAVRPATSTKTADCRSHAGRSAPPRRARPHCGRNVFSRGIRAVGPSWIAKWLPLSLLSRYQLSSNARESICPSEDAAFGELVWHVLTLRRRVGRVDPEDYRYPQRGIDVVDPLRERDVFQIEPPCHKSRNRRIPHSIPGAFRLRQAKGFLGRARSICPRAAMTVNNIEPVGVAVSTLPPPRLRTRMVTPRSLRARLSFRDEEEVVECGAFSGQFTVRLPYSTTEEHEIPDPVFSRAQYLPETPEASRGHHG
jgi:hypothetical protein